MTSSTRPSFWRSYAKLDPTTQEAARKAYRLFEQNPDHPSLQFKKLAGGDQVWSVRITSRHRAIGERHGDTISRMWIGSHKEFDNLFS